jgi:hypothetical protein
MVAPIVGSLRRHFRSRPRACALLAGDYAVVGNLDTGVAGAIPGSLASPSGNSGLESESRPGQQGFELFPGAAFPRRSRLRGCSLAAALASPARLEERGHFRASVFWLSCSSCCFSCTSGPLGLNPQSHDITKNYCAFCFPLYPGFFSHMGFVCWQPQPAPGGRSARTAALPDHPVRPDLCGWSRLLPASPIWTVFALPTCGARVVKCGPACTAEPALILQAKSGLEEGIDKPAASYTDPSGFPGVS